MPDLTCNHADAGLCEVCQSLYRADPGAYLEFGPHPEGEARWQRLLEEMAADAFINAGRTATVADDESIPF